MKTIALLAVLLLPIACQKAEAPTPKTASPVAAAASIPPVDRDNIVSIAVGSKDHTTLVAALKAANYVTSVANPGPLTVFAPTDAAFGKLPPGTVEGLVKPEQQAELREILKYHVTTSVWQAADLKDGLVLSMANGKKATIGNQGGKLTINGNNIIASVRASNGIVHVVDGVLLPPGQ